MTEQRPMQEDIERALEHAKREALAKGYAIAPPRFRMTKQAVEEAVELFQPSLYLKSPIIDQIARVRAEG